ncbi:TrmH family RNA methyltransferase [Altibacter sp. HG106]|uniref:TrmH family RNA methyltransferase n=1 Tax=Altibacter sp. HG106 TaxID=3023937 RepID=UPI002350C6F6|nr:RNA methyltransferase [Altibacter sp. HG106]MDC7993934.1 RNA methyltransferase [Altibacter sp. HG106]
MPKFLSSLQNPLVKKYRLLQEKSKERRQQELFPIEGQREIELALGNGYRLHTLFVQPEIVAEEWLRQMQASIASEAIIHVSTEVYEKLAYRGSTEGVLALAHQKKHSLDELSFTRKNPLLLVAEAPEKPGNIGALLRTADAADLDGIIIANPKTDLYNPNIIRSSVGCLFTRSVAAATTTEIIAWLTKNNIAIYAATLQDAVPYHTLDYQSATAIVVGTEAYGLTEAWRMASKKNIMIPMQGDIDSMNVSVAAGILIFEAKRQRNFE